MSVEIENGIKVWRCADGVMIDEITRAVYGARPGAVEALMQANGWLVHQRGTRLTAGDLVVLPVLPDQTLRRRRLFE